MLGVGGTVRPNRIPLHAALIVLTLAAPAWATIAPENEGAHVARAILDPEPFAGPQQGASAAIDVAALIAKGRGCNLQQVPMADHDGMTSAGADGPTDLVLGTCSGIRPGARVTVGGGCTMSYILTDGTDYYGTIAGHCGNVGNSVRLHNPSRIIGRMIYSVDQPIGEDFGIFRIDKNDESLIDPAMCAWGGPTAMFAPEGDIPDDEDVAVRHFGYGTGFGSVPPARARSGVYYYNNGEAFAFQGTVSPGDSGSPARLGGGEALGVITDLWSPRTPGTGPLLPADRTLLTSLAVGTLLEHGISNAEAATGIEFTLVTASVDNEVEV